MSALEQALAVRRAGPSLAGPSLAGPSLAGPSLAGPSLAGDEVAGDEVAGDEVARLAVDGAVPALIVACQPMPTTRAQAGGGVS
ncbi:hypothetical protein [Actinoplanes rectilineatus]|uniref:hypothetical protein n=1 Tax=Actinoplanes rectilineatus TaxID=113571 RepID=UPI0005F2BF12|nr:hypothetical protein [Actinoplanes rectilineatus]